MPAESLYMQSLQDSTSNVLDNNGSPDIQDKIFSYNDAIIHLRRLVDTWRDELRDTEVRRKTRKVEISVERLRQDNKLDEDETIIPIRTIDVNIQREQPPYINYLKNSRRLAIFRSLDNPQQDTELLELDFTRGMTYIGWEIPYYKCLDGAQTHGWDAVEVTYDPSKPLNCGVEHIGHDRLIFPTKAIDLQQSPRIIRIYDVTITQLQSWVDTYGFDAAQVQILIDSRKDTQKENETIRIYKVYFKKKHDGINCVYVAWFSIHEGVTDWLKQPMKHFVGIKEQQQQVTLDAMGMPQIGMQWVDKPLELYPIFILPYRETEEPEITAHKGRVFYDENKQEAQTAILSGFVNGLTRASNILASPKDDDGTGSSLKEIENVKILGGKILSKPINFWSPPYPDPMVLKTLQYFDVANSEETNQVNFAAMNREDSRKTAKEIGAAQQQQVLLNSVQLTLFSTFVRQVCSFEWLIVQSQAMQNEIRFLIHEKIEPVLNPVTKEPLIGQDGQPMVNRSFENDFATIQQTYDVRAAGDVDVIQKEEMIQKMQMDMPLVMQTLLRDKFIADYFRLKYPESAEQYTSLLGQQGQMQSMQSLIARLGTILQGALTPEQMNTLPAQERSDIAQVMQEAQQFMGGAGGQQQLTQPNA